MIESIPNNVKANKDNDLMHRTSMLSDEERKKLKSSEESINESTNDSPKIEYFTE